MSQLGENVGAVERLDLSVDAAKGEGMSIVVEYSGELYSLIIDSVGEVLSLPPERYGAAARPSRWVLRTAISSQPDGAMPWAFRICSTRP